MVYHDQFAVDTRGGTRSIYDGGGGSDVFFWDENLHARYFFGSRDLPCIFLGLKKYAYCFGSYLRAEDEETLPDIPVS